MFVHGKTIIQESKEKIRQAVEKKVTDIYSRPPILAKRYRPVQEIALEVRLRQSTTQLRDWIDRIDHQKRVSAVLISKARHPGQLTLRQAYANHARRCKETHAYPT